MPGSLSLTDPADSRNLQTRHCGLLSPLIFSGIILTQPRAIVKKIF